MKRLSLQWRVTLLAALILILCTATLTAISIRNATAFVELMDSAVPAVPLQPSREAASQQPITEAMPLISYAMPTEEAKQQFDSSSILACVFFTLVGAGAVYMAAGSALRPLRKLIAEMDSVDESKLTSKLPQAVSGDEISLLTDSFNHMLERLEDAFARRQRFTANAAHELKTPLAILKTGAQVLQADASATLDDYRENNKGIVTSVDRLSKIVDDLLLLAAQGQGTGTEDEEVLLDPLFEAIADELETQLTLRNMVCKIDCGEVQLKGSMLLLYRAFFNLVENACKYGCDGGSIWVTAREDAAAITVSVRDDGPGIAEEHLPYLFDAFYRVDKARSREEGGSGLGLSIVKTMVEANGGSISVQSNGGCCFTATFPKQ